MRFLITAGPTREPIDPVRYLSNRSSGRMGFALAEAAIAAGHDVTIISGPVSLDPPLHATVIDIETAREMYDSVANEIQNVDVAIFCAAVADYRVADLASEKIKKTSDPLNLELIKNPDILGSARTEFGFSGLLVGFAAETNDVEKHARDKLVQKQCDLLVANDVSRSDIGFDHPDNEVTLYFKGGETKAFPLASKSEIAKSLIHEIEELS
mgnify:CR=1 FL=1